MNSKRSRILVPIASRGTIANIKNFIKGIDIMDRPLIIIKPDYNELRRSLDKITSYLNSDGDMVLIFTSKNAVEILVGYLRENNILGKFIHMFNKVICIGPYTLDALVSSLTNYVSSAECGCFLVPKIHSSRGIIHLIEWFEWKPVLFCSKHVDKQLKETVLLNNGEVVELYELGIDNEGIEEVQSIIRSYNAAYMVFMSLQSLKTLDYFRLLRDKMELYGVFLSRRIFEKADTTIFREVFVYDSGEVDEFYKFLEKVVNAR